MEEEKGREEGRKTVARVMKVKEAKWCEFKRHGGRKMEFKLKATEEDRLQEGRKLGGKRT